MKKFRVYHVDAFTTQPFGGNPAGVVPDANGLTDQQMQKIARELNLSETAFLFPATQLHTDYKVRYFTPETEIDFCGHATIATSWIMATEYGWAEKTDRVVLDTNIGIVPVEFTKNPDGMLTSVVMTMISPKVKDYTVAPSQIADLVGIDASDIDDRFPIRLASAGNWHLLVPIKSRAAIDAAQPKHAELGVFNRKDHVISTHLFTFESKEGDYDLYTRDFTSAVGIIEDPVTGSANGALAGYLVLEGILSEKETHQLTIAQGDAIGRPGRLYVTILPDESATVIRVGGSAVPVMEGLLLL